MFIETKKIETKYTRSSKLKKSHAYTRTKTLVIFRCDSCQSLFEREQGKMDKQRISNHYFHVCANCNPKQFAQMKGVEQRKIWSLSADSDRNIG
jgi:hypothetical protein